MKIRMSYWFSIKDSSEAAVLVDVFLPSTAKVCEDNKKVGILRNFATSFNRSHRERIFNSVRSYEVMTDEKKSH